MDLFEELGQVLKPVEFTTITAFLTGGKTKVHYVIKGTSAREIESFLMNVHGFNCWSWE